MMTTAVSRAASRVVAAVLLALVTIVIAVTLPGAGYVTLSITNASEFDILVEARSTRPGWMGVGYVAPKSTEEIREVADQGSMWILRFTAQGVVGGELQLSRRTLEANEWRVSVPTRVIDLLRRTATPPPPT
jgi:hypothetical protein